MRYNFFMLQSDVLPNMGFSPTRKRLVHSYECIREGNMEQVDPPVASKFDDKRDEAVAANQSVDHSEL